jgi:hypothetical protein
VPAAAAPVHAPSADPATAWKITTRAVRREWGGTAVRECESAKVRKCESGSCEGGNRARGKEGAWESLGGTCTGGARALRGGPSPPPALLLVPRNGRRPLSQPRERGFSRESPCRIATDSPVQGMGSPFPPKLGGRAGDGGLRPGARTPPTRWSRSSPLSARSLRGEGPGEGPPRLQDVGFCARPSVLPLPRGAGGGGRGEGASAGARTPLPRTTCSSPPPAVLGEVARNRAGGGAAGRRLPRPDSASPGESRSPPSASRATRKSA